jgi:hypothetical protein
MHEDVKSFTTTANGFKTDLRLGGTVENWALRVKKKKSPWMGLGLTG